ncbi:MAG: hypothetical protein EAX90_14640 [Candidatus Heimdallarchaeota archaeon]|nr:hypothetical protein [Candidatus Heimdallarchaeota archaeon]
MVLSKVKLFPSKKSINLKKFVYCLLFVIFLIICSQNSNFTSSKQNSLINSSEFSDLNSNSRSSLSDPFPDSDLTLNRFDMIIYNIDVKNELAFVEDGRDAITIINLSKPTKPLVENILFVPGLVHFVANEDFLFTFSQHEFLQIILQKFDISDPRHPFEVLSFNLTEKAHCRDAFIFNDSLFFVQTNNTKYSDSLFYVSLKKIDLTSSPVEVEIYREYGFNDSDSYFNSEVIDLDIFCLENSAFLSIEYNGFVHINLTDNSILDDTFNSTINPNEIFVYKDHVFVTDLSFGLEIFDYQNNNNTLTQIGNFSSNGGFGSFCIKDDYLYASYKNGGIKILDVSNPEIPTEEFILNYKFESKFFDYVDYPGYAVGVFTQDDYLIIGEGLNDFIIFDISNPLQPKEVLLNSRFVYWSLIFIPLIVVIYLSIQELITSIRNKRVVIDPLLQSDEVSKPAEIIAEKEFPKKYNPFFIKLLRISLLVFLAQNVSALLFLCINLFGWVKINSPNQYVLLSIPLILDLIVALMFIVVMILFFIERRNLSTIICAIFWIIWIGIALFYRISAGMPGFAVLDQMVMGEYFDVGYPYGDTFWISLYFTFSSCAFWFANYFTDKAMESIHQEKKMINLTLYASTNLIISVFTAILLLFLQEISDLTIIVLGFIFIFLVIGKIIFVPVIGGVATYLTQRRINLDILKISKEV